MNKEKLLFLINPISGGKSKKRIVVAIEQYLDHAQFDYELITTEYAGHVAVILEERMDVDETVIAVGGDGTVNEIAKVLTGTKKAMGIIPQGSGNGLARHLNIPINPVKAILQLNHSVKTPIDTASLNNHFFVSIAGVGFDSLIAQKFASSTSRGFLGYASLVLKEYFKFKEQDYHLILDGKEKRTKAAFISFANSNQFGYNTVIAPHAHIADGLLDVCIMRKPRLFQIPSILLKVWTKRAHQSKLLEIIRAKSIVLQPNMLQYANVDGESVEVGESIEISLKPKSLYLKLPQNG
jgi:YegS/Rv2252/BmrU family lipid kinase